MIKKSKQLLILLTALAVFVTGAVMFQSCSDDDSPGLAISTFEPTLGGAGTQVVITGTGFSKTLADNQVTFNGIEVSEAGMVSVNSNGTELTVVTPEGTETGKIEVTVNDKTVQSETDFRKQVSTYAEGGTFSSPNGIVYDPASGNMYVADYGSHKILKIAPDGTVSTLAGTGTAGSTDHQTGTMASFNNPYALTLDGVGNIYVADYGNNKIRKVTPEGAVSTLTLSDGVMLNHPTGIVYRNSGYLFVADYDNMKLHVIEMSSGNTADFLDFSWKPFSIAISPDHNTLYVSDYNGHKVFRFPITGAVSWEAGTGQVGSDNATDVTLASFNYPTGLGVDADGNVYVADSRNNKIRKITIAADGSATSVSTVCGDGQQGSDDGSAANASFYYPYNVTFDSDGNMYVADRNNNKIRKVILE